MRRKTLLFSALFAENVLLISANPFTFTAYYAENRLVIYPFIKELARFHLAA
jgi:hypothetical protein